MPFTRLPESVQSLYAELLDQLQVADAEDAVGGASGSFVSKRIRGRTYWYLQKSEGATKRQIYLGVESPALLERIQAAGELRNERLSDARRRHELVTMLAAGGMFREGASVATVLRVLGEASVFRAGGVLVGTQAFTCIANMLGVFFEKKACARPTSMLPMTRTFPSGSTGGERKTICWNASDPAIRHSSP